MLITKVFKIYKMNVQTEETSGGLFKITRHRDYQFYFRTLEEAERFHQVNYPNADKSIQALDAIEHQGRCKRLIERKLGRYAREIKIDEDVLKASIRSGIDSLIAVKMEGTDCMKDRVKGVDFLSEATHFVRREDVHCSSSQCPDRCHPRLMKYDFVEVKLENDDLRAKFLKDFEEAKERAFGI